MFKDVVEAVQAEQDQDADCARIAAAIHLAEHDIAALESRHLELHERRKRWFAIRDQTILAVREVRSSMIKRAIEAKETRSWMVETFFSKSNRNTEFAAILQDIPTKGLLDYLRYLISVGDVHRVQCVRDVFKARSDRRQYNVTFEKMLAQFVFAEFGDFEERLTRICDSADKVDAKLADVFAAYGSTSRLPQLMVCTDVSNATQMQDDLIAA
jgi:hypothetical protein